jgi:hypothetical protein
MAMKVSIEAMRVKMEAKKELTEVVKMPLEVASVRTAFESRYLVVGREVYKHPLNTLLDTLRAKISEVRADMDR